MLKNHNIIYTDFKSKKGLFSKLKITRKRKDKNQISTNMIENEEKYMLIPVFVVVCLFLVFLSGTIK